MAKDYEQEINALQEKLNKKKAQLKKKNAHAMQVIAELVCKAGKVKDWREIDFDKLSAYLNKYGYKINQECTKPKSETWQKDWDTLKKFEQQQKQQQHQNTQDSDNDIFCF